MMPACRFALALSLAALTASCTRAGDWPQFRGPNGSAVADDTGLPAKWSTTENVRWKIDLPGRGVGNPVIAGGHVFVTASSGWQQDRLHVLASTRLMAKSVGNGNSGPPAAPRAIRKPAWPGRHP